MLQHTFGALAIRLTGTPAASQLLGPILRDRGSDIVAVAFCDTESALLGLTCYTGAEPYVELPVKEVLRDALTCEASGIVVGHNEPEQTAKPSESDVKITNRLLVAAEELGITLLDHIVFGEGPSFSYRQQSLI